MIKYIHKYIFNLTLLVTILSLTSCGSIKKRVDFNDYKNIEPFLNDYVSQTYLKTYLEDYNEFIVDIDTLKNDYFLITVSPFVNNVILNSSDYKKDDIFPQSYKEISEETFFIDFLRKRPSNKVYSKLLEKNKIDSTYILVEQGKLSEELAVIIEKYDDSIFTQNYLVKRKLNKLKLIYEWYGDKVTFLKR